MNRFQRHHVLFLSIPFAFSTYSGEINNTHIKTNHALHDRKAPKKRRKHHDTVFPPMFGKTHFILGFDHRAYELEKEKAQTPETFSYLCSPKGKVKRALFSPDDNIRKTLINLIKQEQDSIKIAIFSFTDQGIADSLVEAMKHGIHIDLVTDPYTLHTPYSKIDYLKQRGINVHVYKPSQMAMNDKMHDKFILFKKNINGKALLCTGSYNFTKSADKNNQENIIVLEDHILIEQFNAQFDKLKQRSRLLEASAEA